MVIVEERNTCKVPGITSVFFTFPYNKELWGRIIQLPVVNYSKKTKEYEVPIQYLSMLLDILCCYDEIELRLCELNFNFDNEVEISEHKTKPFDYQEDGIKYGLTHDRWLLLDPPGLGKSLQIIYVAEEFKKRENLEHCLVICGVNSLKANWEKEIKTHSVLDSTVLGKRVNTKGKVVYDGIKERVEQLKKPIKEFFVITNIETLRSDEIVKAILKGPNKFDMIVVDEIHCCKNPSSQQTVNLLKLTQSKYRIGATGTLLINNPIDCYVPLKWIDADRSTQGNFTKYYYIYGGKFGRDIVGYRNLDTLKKQLELYSLRRPKSILNLPDKIINYEYLDMEDKQRKFYDEIIEGVIKDFSVMKVKDGVVKGLATRLRQATAYPSMLTTEQVPSVKIDRAIDYVEQFVADNEKVVIFSTFKEPVYKLAELLKEYNPLIGTGDMSDEEVFSNMQSFQTDDKNKVFIGTWQKCGTGFTLTAASNMIFIDTPYTDAKFVQACDRIHRIGTDKSVLITVLVVNNSIDERVKEIVESKEAMADYVVDDELSEKGLQILKTYIKELQENS